MPAAQLPSGARIVTGAGEFGGPVVNEFDPATGALTKAFLPYDPAFIGGVRVASCDFTGDGIPDIVTGAGPYGGAPHVRVFDGSGGLQIPGPLGSFYAYDPSVTAGMFVACADITGDGIPEIIT